jgi:hypothetical protein
MTNAELQNIKPGSSVISTVTLRSGNWHLAPIFQTQKLDMYRVYYSIGYQPEGWAVIFKTGERMFTHSNTQAEQWLKS